MRSKRVVLTTAVALGLTATGCADTGGSGNSSGGTNAASGSECFTEGPMTLIVGYDAGGSTDVGARLLATELEKELDATITVENKPGAGGQVGLTALANADADGYTFGTVNFPSAIVSVLDESRGATYTKDSFAPVALQVIDPTALAVAPDSPIESPTDLVEAAEENPGQLRATTTGVASNEHFALLELQEQTGAELSPVHFSEGSAPAETAFLGGNVEVLVGNVSDVSDLVESDQAKVIGVMEEEPSPFLPDVPTFAEEGYDVAISSSRGYAFPADAPEECVTAMSDAIGTIMEDEQFASQMEELGLAPSYMDAEAYDAYWTETGQQFEDLFPLVREGN
jgi:tripartite-type tricarboxylate transporter receptor subunit TctC